MRKAATLPDLSVRIMLRILAEEGLETAGVLAAAGFAEGVPALPGTVTPAQEFAVQRAFVEATGYRPDLWLRTGLRYHLPNYGELGLALLTAPDLGEMAETSAGARDLDYSLARITPIHQHGALVGHEIDIHDVADVLRDFTAYRDIGALTTALRDVWNGRFPIGRIEVALPRPSQGELGEACEPFVFDADRTAITWNGEHSAARLYYSDEVLHAAYLAECRLKARVRGAKDDLVDMLARSLTGGTGSIPSLGALAAEAGMSERTLQRRLQDRGVKFRDLVEEARRQVAIELLTMGSTPIAEIAWRLGYSDTTSFAHAFRRWTGVAPGAARRGSRPPGPR
jgi:AraC-like DNA-binding protein